MKTLIVDDEPITQDILKRYSERLHFLQVVGVCDNAIEGMETIHSLKPDLIFLDIQMPEMIGREMLTAVNNYSSQIVFTTTYPDDAFKGFDLNVLDYLLKPISFEGFSKAAKKAYDNYTLRKARLEPTEDIGFVSSSKMQIWIKEGKKILQININDIILVEAMADYVNLQLPDNRITIHATMKKMESLLLPPSYLRVNRSTIIRTSAIQSIEDRQIETTISGYGRVSIGSTYWHHVKAYIKTWIQ